MCFAVVLGIYERYSCDTICRSIRFPVFLLGPREFEMTIVLMLVELENRSDITPQEQLSQMYLSPLMVRLEGVQIDKSHIM